MKGKIVFVVPCLRSGGAERVMVLLANSLVEKGYETGFLFTMDDVVSYEPNKKVTICCAMEQANGCLPMMFLVR